MSTVPRLYNTDCLAVLPEIDSGSIDLVIADPPYGVTCCEWDKSLSFAQIWSHLARIVKPNAAVIFFAVQPYATDLIEAQRKYAPKLRFRYDMIWLKSLPTNALNCSRQPSRAHELLLVFYARQPVYNPQLVDGGKSYIRHRLKLVSTARQERPGVADPGFGYLNGEYDDKVWKCSGLKWPTTILKYPSLTNHRTRFHPTQKPEDLCRKLVETYTDAGAVVLDPFMGSGTTGVVCVQTDRNFVGIEISPEYYTIAVERINRGKFAPSPKIDAVGEQTCLPF